jgi:hypothetical protein
MCWRMARSVGMMRSMRKDLFDAKDVRIQARGEYL